MSFKSNFGITVKEKEGKQDVDEEKAFEDMLVKSGAKGSYMVFTDFMKAPKHLQILDKNAKEELLPIWIRNFARNFIAYRGYSLIAMRKGKGKKAIVVGAGPSLEKNKHLLTELKEDMDIFCTDRALSRITPIITPTFVVSVDADKKIVDYYKDFKEPSIGILAMTCDEGLMMKTWNRQYWYIPSIDQHTDNILSLMVDFVPVIKSYGNVGVTCCSIAEYLMYEEIILLGMDLSYEEGTQLEQTDWYNKFKATGAEEETIQKAFTYGEHPTFKTKYISDPLFDAYKHSFLEFVAKSKCKIMNCTEGGSIFGNKIECKKLEEVIEG